MLNLPKDSGCNMKELLNIKTNIHINPLITFLQLKVMSAYKRGVEWRQEKGKLKFKDRQSNKRGDNKYTL